ncbi:MAG: TolC family protein [Deltaproteobacteria bacterium]|nr:TolC family protein [Deltaproteobacteria bacterium]
MTARNLGLGLALILWGASVFPGGTAEPPAPHLDLREALRLAFKANPNLQISRLQALIAGEQVVRARSGLLPQVKTQVGQTIYDDPLKFKIGGGLPGASGGISFPQTNRNFWSSQTSVNQLVFDFWGTPAKYMAAIKGHQASLLDTAQTRDNVFLTVAQGYFKTLRAQKMVEVAKQNVFDLKEHLRIAQDQHQFGIVTFNDVLQAKVSLADAQQNLIVAQTDFIDIRSSLNKVLMLPVSAPTVLKDEKVDLKAWALGDATDAALKRRSDLKASQERIHAQEKQVVETRARLFPQFAVQAGHNYQVNNSLLHNHQWFVIFGMNWNIFSGLDTKAAISQARLKVQQLQEQHKDMNEQVQLDVQTAYLKIKETVDRIRTTETAVTQGEENLRLNEERYKESVGTATDVIDADTLLTRTRVNYWTAVYDHQMAKAQMLWAIGGINELLPQENQPRHGP